MHSYGTFVGDSPQVPLVEDSPQTLIDHDPPLSSLCATGSRDTTSWKLYKPPMCAKVDAPILFEKETPQTVVDKVKLIAADVKRACPGLVLDVCDPEGLKFSLDEKQVGISPEIVLRPRVMSEVVIVAVSNRDELKVTIERGWNQGELERKLSRALDCDVRDFHFRNKLGRFVPRNGTLLSDITPFHGSRQMPYGESPKLFLSPKKKK